MDSTTRGREARTIDVKRILSAAVLTAAVLGVLAADWALGTSAGFYLAWGLMVGLALVEFFGLARGGGIVPLTLFGITLGVALALLPLPGGWRTLRTAPAAAAVLLVAVAAALAFDLTRRRGMRVDRLDRRALLITLAGICWIGLLGAYVTKVRSIEPTGTALLLLILAVAKGGDVAAYFTGRRFGRHKLAPAVSPNKTREGALGGLAAGIGIAVGGSFVLGEAVLSLGQAVLFGLLVGIAAQAGDLAESWYKRKMHAKDSGRLLPHYGGILDVTDALFFAVPTAYYLLRLFET